MKEPLLWISLAVVVIALFLFSPKRAREADGTPKSFFSRTGWAKICLSARADNRDSTSKTVVLGWTVIVAWLAIACVLKSGGVETAFDTAIAGPGTSYFAVLGASSAGRCWRRSW